MSETFAFDPLSLVPEPVDDPEFMQPPEPDVDGNENYDRPIVDFVKKPRAKAHTSEYERYSIRFHYGRNTSSRLVIAMAVVDLLR